MKNAIISGNTFMRFARPSFLALFIAALLSTAPAQAADTKPNEAPVEVKYLGSTEGKPLFQLTFNNLQGEEFALTLRDENGVVIYSDTAKDKVYSRKFRFDELDNDKLKLTVTLRTKKETQTKTFAITKSTRTIEDIAVVSL